MKLTSLYIKLLLSLIIVILGCRPDDDFPALKDPLAVKPKLLEGTWKVKSVVQYDKEALDNGFPEEVLKRDITSMFPFTNYTVTFNLDADGRPGTFQVTPGNAPNFINLNSGVWSVDDYVFATTITLTNPSDVNASSFRVKFLQGDKIVLHVVRNDAQDNTEYSYYEYEFTKN